MRWQCIVQSTGAGVGRATTKDMQSAFEQGRDRDRRRRPPQTAQNPMVEALGQLYRGYPACRRISSPGIDFVFCRLLA